MHLGAETDVRLTLRTVEIFLRGERIAAHLREGGVGKHTTKDEHMPEVHRAYAGWTLENARRQARQIGPAADLLVRLILESKRHPIQGLRACTGILRLARLYGSERLENACTRALEIGARSYASVRSILDNGLDRGLPGGEDLQNVTPIHHQNLRGAGYYRQ